ncbi:GAF domain-containing protein [Nonomuraea antimicrobica]
MPGRSSPGCRCPWTAAGRPASGQALSGAAGQGGFGGRVRGADHPGQGRRRGPGRHRGAGAGQGRGAQGARAAQTARAAGGGAVGPVRHGGRPGRAARPRRRAGGDRAPGQAAPGHRRGLHDPARPRAGRHVHAGHGRVDLGEVPGVAAGHGGRSRRAGGADGHPYSTADYFADARFRHKEHIDEAVKEEGLVAILGVPLRLGQRVIGVLMAANRSARPFHQEEVSLLASLAAHAAVAIDNARLLQETRNALEELSQAHRTAREHGEAVERAAMAHDRMTSLVLRGGGIEDVAAVVTDVLGGSLAVLDDLGRAISGDVGELDAGVFEAAQASRALGRTVRRGDLLIASVDVGGEPLCTLILRSDDADERILERAALVCALLLLFRRSVAEAEGRVRGELLDDLISRPGSPGLADRARRLGMDLGAPHVVVVVKHSGQRERAAFWASSQATVRHGLAAGRGEEEVVLLLPGQDAGGLAQRAAAELTTSLHSPATAGASPWARPRCATSPPPTRRRAGAPRR